MTPRRETRPGTSSTPGIGLTFLRLVFGDPLGFCREAAGSSERVDGGGGLDDSSFERGQRKESIAYISGASFKSLESCLRVFETMRATRIEVGEYKPARGSDAWMWEGAYASCLNDVIYKVHARSGADYIPKKPYMHTT